MQTLLYISILNTYIDLYSDKKITRLSFLIIFVLYIIKSHIKIILFYFMPRHDNSTKKILRKNWSWYSYHYKKKKRIFSTISFLPFPWSAVLIVLYLAVHLPSRNKFRVKVDPCGTFYTLHECNFERPWWCSIAWRESWSSIVCH